MAIKKKHILMVNTNMHGGGAARVMHDIGSSINDKQFTISYYTASDSVFAKFVRMGVAMISANDQVWGKDITTIEAYNQSKVIHLHNLHGNYFNLASLAKVGRNKKIIWTLHDFWAINAKSPTDGVERIYDYPQMLWDNNARLRASKSKLYEDLHNLTIVAPSRFMQNCVNASILGSHRTIYIPNGVDTELYQPGDLVRAREKLDLPQSTSLALFVANGGIHNPYKGGNDLLGLASSSPDTTFVVVGGEEGPRLVNVIYRPLVSKKVLAEYYHAANCLLAPAYHEVFGLSIAEALSSGLAIVGYKTGGIPELVEDNKNGYLVKRGEITALAQALNRVLRWSNGKRQIIAKANRAKAIKSYSLATMSKEYTKLYSQV